MQEVGKHCRTPVLWEQDGEGALLEQAAWVVLLAELGDLPVIDAVMIPGLGLVMLWSKEVAPLLDVGHA